MLEPFAFCLFITFLDQLNMASAIGIHKVMKTITRGVFGVMEL